MLESAVSPKMVLLRSGEIPQAVRLVVVADRLPRPAAALEGTGMRVDWAQEELACETCDALGS